MVLKFSSNNQELNFTTDKLTGCVKAGLHVIFAATFVALNP